MNKHKEDNRIFSLVLASILLSGCAEKSGCDLPTRHVHKYVKNLSNGLTITKYLDSEDTSIHGYDWTNEYILINKVDEKFFDITKGMFLGADNWDYLYNVMASKEDYLKFFYEYDSTETYTETDSDGKTHIKTKTVHHEGWHTNPYDSDNTGKVRLYHHRFNGYRVVYKNNYFTLEKSDAVDDIREIITEYPYFYEKCTTEVYFQFKVDKHQLPYLSPSDFDVFKHPDLENKSMSLEEENKKVLK